jgi:hypothetical protein
VLKHINIVLIKHRHFHQIKPNQKNLKLAFLNDSLNILKNKKSPHTKKDVMLKQK